MFAYVISYIGLCFCIFALYFFMQPYVCLCHPTLDKVQEHF